MRNFVIAIVFFISSAWANFELTRVEFDKIGKVKQIFSDNLEQLFVVNEKGELWQTAPVKLLTQNVSPEIKPVALNDTIAFADDNGNFALFTKGQKYRSKIKLAPNAGMLKLAFATIAIAQVNGQNRLVRIERFVDKLDITAVANLIPLPDAQPLQINLDGNSTYNAHIAILANPSDKYSHAVLGDDLEATEIHYLERHSLQPLARPLILEKGVFEANSLKSVNLNNANGLVTVISGVTGGASTAVIIKENSNLKILAESEPLMRFRWQSPFIFNTKIYAVQMPHLAGELVEFSKNLTPIFLGDGFSNHKIGSRNTDLTASTENFAVIPLAGYKRIKILDRFNNLHQVLEILPARIIQTLNLHDNVYLLLENGRIYRVNQNKKSTSIK